MAKRKYDYDLIVLGSGAAGSVAAHIAAQSGKLVAMVEMAEMGGSSANWGCVPTKALLHAAEVYDMAKHAQPFGIRSTMVSYNYPSIKAWKDMAVKRSGAGDSKRFYEAEGIKIIPGEAHFITPHEITVNRRHYSSEQFLIATGAKNFIPAIEGIDKIDYLTDREAINLNRPPKSLFIVGGGTTGCEFAQLFSIFGTKVHIADITPRLLVREDQEVSELAKDQFENERGMVVLCNTKVIKVAKEGLMKRVTYQHGSQVLSVKVEEVLIAAGKLPSVDMGLENAQVEYTPRGITVNNQLQTTAKHIFAAGDVIEPYMYTHVSIYQSRVAVNNMLHRDKVTVDYRAVPRCTFLVPEVASVGMSEDECIKRDMAIQKAVAPLHIIGRANINNTTKGFVKVIADKSGVLLGATIVSPTAGEMIHELTLAIQLGLTGRHVANTMHAFPTWSEAVRIACGKIK